MKSGGIKIAVFLALASLSTGCAKDSYIRGGSAQHLSVIQLDKASLDLQAHENLPKSLSVEQAVQRALNKNLDAYVASLETVIASNNVTLQSLAMLPTVNATGTFTQRSNEAASSSESIITRTQSLEPSTSSEPERRLATLEAQWNMLDAVIALVDKHIAGNNETIALERLRKVRHNIERDVTAAYWKAFTFQQVQGDINQIDQNVSNILSNVEKAQEEKLIAIDDASQRVSQLTNKNLTLNQLEEEVKLSNIEFKSLTSLPLYCDVALTGQPTDFEDLYPELFAMGTDDLIVKALLQRPEMRENIANRNIASETIKREIIGTFPGLDLVYSYNYDSNKFLTEQSWEDLNISLLQSITSIITLPKRYSAAKDRRKLADAQRLALTAAITAQIHVAKLRIEIAKDNYATSQKLYRMAEIKALADIRRKHEGAISGIEKTLSSSDMLVQKIQMQLAYAALQRSYADLIGSMGLVLYPAQETSQHSTGGDGHV